MKQNSLESTIFYNIIKIFSVTIVCFVISFLSLFVFQYISLKDEISSKSQLFNNALIIKKANLSNNVSFLYDNFDIFFQNSEAISSFAKSFAGIEKIFLLKDLEVIKYEKNTIVLPNFNLQHLINFNKTDGLFLSDVFEVDGRFLLVSVKKDAQKAVVVIYNYNIFSDIFQKLDNDDINLSIVSNMGKFIFSQNKIYDKSMNYIEFFGNNIKNKELSFVVNFNKDLSFIYMDNSIFGTKIILSKHLDYRFFIYICLYVIMFIFIVFFIYKHMISLNKNIISPIKSIKFNIKQFISKNMHSYGQNDGDDFDVIINQITQIFSQYYKKTSEHANIKNQFETIFENELFPILFVDACNGQILKANKKAIDFYEYPNMQILTIFDLKVGNFLDDIQSKITSSFKKIPYYITKHKTKSDKTVNVRVFKKHFGMEQGFWIYVIFDVSEFENFYKNTTIQRDIYNQGYNVILRYDFDNNTVIDASSNTYEIWGYHSDDIKSGKVNFLGLIHKDDLKRVLHEILNNVNLFKNSIKIQQFIQEYRLLHSSGKYFRYRVLVKFFKNFEQESNVVFYFQNIENFLIRQERDEINIQRYKNILEASSFSIWEWDFAKNLITFGDKFALIRGYNLNFYETQMSYERFKSIIFPQDVEKFNLNVERYINGLTSKLNLEIRIVKKDKSCAWISIKGASIERDSNGVVKFLCGIIDDISNKKAGENTLKSMARVFSYSHEGIAITDSKGIILSVNNSFEKITQYSKSEIIGKLYDIFKLKKDSEIYQDFVKSIRLNGFFRTEIWAKRKDLTIYPQILTISAVIGEDKKISQYVIVFMEITKIKEKENLLKQKANFDQLTNLPNKEYFKECTTQKLKSLSNNEHGVVLFIDFDGFKQINDNFGHKVGDQYLQEISKVLHSVIRENDILGRLGGDEFGAFLNVKNRHEALLIVDRLIKNGTTSVSIGDFKVKCSLSIGVVFCDANSDFDEAIKLADKAMYQAKLAGKNRFVVAS